MKLKTVITLMACVFLYMPLYSEAVFLKDGSIIDGSIISDAAGSVTLRMADKKTKQIPRSDIMRILYTELKMGKIYVQKRDGKGLVAYLVDEDRASYTFRKELYAPEEFTLKRSDVLFMAEKNPSGLQIDGEIGTDRVSLFWLPPYDAVKKYNLYIKKNEKDKYELVESTGSKSINLRNLSSNTSYFIIVTSLDSDGYESSPSNEIQIKTKNIPPEEPVLVSLKSAGTNGIKITWSDAIDPDGKIVKYRLYGIKDEKRSLLAEVKATEYILANASGYDRVELTSVDDKGDDSSAVKVTEGRLVTEFSPGIFMPLGELGEMAAMGYGGTVCFRVNDLFIDNLNSGIEAGFYYIPGKDEIDTIGQNVKRLNYASLGLRTGWDFKISKKISFTPSLLIGAAYIDLSYRQRDFETMKDSEKSAKGFDPLVEASLSLEYNISGSFHIGVNAGYGALVETKRMLQFAKTGISCGVRF